MKAFALSVFKFLFKLAVAAVVGFGVALTTALIVSSPVFAADDYAVKSRAVAEVMLKAALNDPDSLKVDSMTLYRREPFANACGTLRAKNAFGGVIRANFVVSDNPQLPVYVGPIPLTVFKKECSGEIVE